MGTVDYQEDATLQQMLQDPVIKLRFDEWLGRDPHPSGRNNQGHFAPFLNLSSTGTPEYRFEWHPQKRIVYLIRLAAVPLIGEAMAFNIETHGDAINAVRIWLRGYNEAKTPSFAKSHLQV